MGRSQSVEKMLWLSIVQSGALSLVQIHPDTLLSLVEPYYAGAITLCHNNTPQGTNKMPSRLFVHRVHHYAIVRTLSSLECLE